MQSNTSTKHRIVFFGTDHSSAVVLNDLLKTPYIEIIAIVTQPAKNHGHSHQRTSPVAQIANDHHIKTFTPHKLTEITQQLTSLKPTAGLLFAYGKILPDETINIFPKGIINIHPSLLPKHRGPSPLENTILNGDTIAGTSIMLITSDMDAGPIIAQKSFPIREDITKELLWEKLLSTSQRLLKAVLHNYLDNVITPHPQSTSIQPSYSRIIKKSDGNIDPSTTTTKQLIRLIRAYSGWPGVRIPVLMRGTTLPLSIHEVKSINDQPSKVPQLCCTNKHLLLQLNDGTIEILRAQLPNKGIVTGRDLCNTGSISLT